MLQKKHNPNWQPQIPDYPYRILIIGGSGSEKKQQKTNALLNLIKQQDDDYYSIIDQIYLYVKDLNETNTIISLKSMKKLVL